MSKRSFALSAAFATLLFIGAGCAPAAPSSDTPLPPAPAEPAAPAAVAPEAASVGEVKEFAMDSWYEMKDGKPAQFFSLKEMTVKNGDRVRVLVNVKNGRHDFVIDELNVKAETPTGTVTTVEFTADKTGEFVYYCSMPNHRANGQWGTLIVTE